MGNTAATPAQGTDRPWHRRSPLWDHEHEIRRLIAQGHSLRQVIDRLDLDVSRPCLWRWLKRAGEARDAAALLALDASGFVPPTLRTPK
jgi:hypothetical protein